MRFTGIFLAGLEQDEVLSFPLLIFIKFLYIHHRLSRETSKILNAEILKFGNLRKISEIAFSPFTHRKTIILHA